MIENKAVLIGLTGLLVCGICPAREVEELPPLTVLARRLDSPGNDNASSVGIVTAEELARMQRHRLLDSLNLIPGTQALSTAGLTGNTGTAIIRGLPSRYQQLVVDGVKISDATNGIGNFLANGNLGNITNLEVLRGPQSVLYGTGAGGGVIGYETAVGSGAPGFRFSGEGGSFDSARFSLSSQGRLENFSYGAGIGRQFTSNDIYPTLPIHDYEQNYANLALQWQFRDDLRVKVSYRGSDNFLKTRALTSFGPSDSVVQTETSLFAFNAFYEVTPGWESRLTLGYYQENYRGDFGGFHYGTDYERFTFNWSNEIEIKNTLTAVAGLEAAHSDFANTSDRSSNFSNFGAYSNLYYRPVESLLFEAGGRYDEHEEFGGDTAWNLGVVSTFDQPGTRLHARWSEAYRNPTRLDSEFFPSPFSTQLANPNLESESIRGYEVGVSQSIGDHNFAVTYFHQKLEDAIVTSSPSPGNTLRTNSSGSSAVSGLEVEANGHFQSEKIHYRLAFTSQFDEEVIDLPDHLVSLDVHYDGGSWLAGAGLSYADGAAYLAPGNPQTDARFLTRIYGEYRINENLTLHARVENLFDEEYENFPDTFGPGSQIEGPGRAFHAGVTYSW
jgi:outer membrane cobalamin receptor